MKICYLSNTAVPSKSAASIQIIKMCENFSKLNNKVLLITSNASKENVFDFYGVKKSFQITKLKNFETFPLGVKYYLFSIVSILESLKFNPDIYITRNFFTSFLLSILRKKNILELHHGIDMEGRIVRYILKFFNFLNSKYLLKLLAITNSVKIYYQKQFKVNEEKFIVLPSGSSIERKLPIEIFKKNKKLKIGYFGSIYKSRGVNLILRLSKIDNENDYFIFGNLSQYKNIKTKFYNNNLKLHDYLPYKKIPSNISKMDILLMPYQETAVASGNVGNIIDFTSPLKLFDYLACGKIILSSKVKVFEEVLEDKKNVIFIKNFNNINSWKKEIKKIQNLESKRLIISKNNLKISKNFNLKTRAKKILEIVSKDVDISK